MKKSGTNTKMSHREMTAVGLMLIGAVTLMQGVASVVSLIDVSVVRAGENDNDQASIKKCTNYTIDGTVITLNDALEGAYWCTKPTNDNLETVNFKYKGNLNGLATLIKTMVEESKQYGWTGVASYAATNVTLTAVDANDPVVTVAKVEYSGGKVTLDITGTMWAVYQTESAKDGWTNVIATFESIKDTDFELVGVPEEEHEAQTYEVKSSDELKEVLSKVKSGDVIIAREMVNLRSGTWTIPSGVTLKLDTDDITQNWVYTYDGTYGSLTTLVVEEGARIEGADCYTLHGAVHNYGEIVTNAGNLGGSNRCPISFFGQAAAYFVGSDDYVINNYASGKIIIGNKTGTYSRSGTNLKDVGLEISDITVNNYGILEVAGSLIVEGSEGKLVNHGGTITAPVIYTNAGGEYSLDGGNTFETNQVPVQSEADENPQTYQISTKEEFLSVISNVKSGDKIEYTGSLSLSKEENVTIPAGVTVEMIDPATTGNVSIFSTDSGMTLTVEEGAKLIGSSLILRGDTNNYGEINTRAWTTTFSSTPANNQGTFVNYATGKLILNRVANNPEYEPTYGLAMVVNFGTVKNYGEITSTGYIDLYSAQLINYEGATLNATVYTELSGQYSLDGGETFVTNPKPEIKKAGDIIEETDTLVTYHQDTTVAQLYQALQEKTGKAVTNGSVTLSADGDDIKYEVSDDVDLATTVAGLVDINKATNRTKTVVVTLGKAISDAGVQEIKNPGSVDILMSDSATTQQVSDAQSIAKTYDVPAGESGSSNGDVFVSVTFDLATAVRTISKDSRSSVDYFPYNNHNENLGEYGYTWVGKQSSGIRAQSRPVTDVDDFTSLMTLTKLPYSGEEAELVDLSYDFMRDLEVSDDKHTSVPLLNLEVKDGQIAGGHLYADSEFNPTFDEIVNYFEKARIGGKMRVSKGSFGNETYVFEGKNLYDLSKQEDTYRAEALEATLVDMLTLAQTSKEMTVSGTTTTTDGYARVDYSIAADVSEPKVTLSFGEEFTLAQIAQALHDLNLDEVTVQAGSSKAYTSEMVSSITREEGQTIVVISDLASQAQIAAAKKVGTDVENTVIRVRAFDYNLAQALNMVSEMDGDVLYYTAETEQKYTSIAKTDGQITVTLPEVADMKALVTSLEDIGLGSLESEINFDFQVKVGETEMALSVADNLVNKVTTSEALTLKNVVDTYKEVNSTESEVFATTVDLASSNEDASQVVDIALYPESTTGYVITLNDNILLASVADDIVSLSEETPLQVKGNGSTYTKESASEVATLELARGTYQNTLASTLAIAEGGLDLNVSLDSGVISNYSLSGDEENTEITVQTRDNDLTELAVQLAATKETATTIAQVSEAYGELDGEVQIITDKRGAGLQITLDGEVTDNAVASAFVTELAQSLVDKQLELNYIDLVAGEDKAIVLTANIGRDGSVSLDIPEVKKADDALTIVENITNNINVVINVTNNYFGNYSVAMLPAPTSQGCNNYGIGYCSSNADYADKPIILAQDMIVQNVLGLIQSVQTGRPFVMIVQMNNWIFADAAETDSFWSNIIKPVMADTTTNGGYYVLESDGIGNITSVGVADLSNAEVRAVVEQYATGRENFTLKLLTSTTNNEGVVDFEAISATDTEKVTAMLGQLDAWETGAVTLTASGRDFEVTVNSGKIAKLTTLTTLGKDIINALVAHTSSEFDVDDNGTSYQVKDQRIVEEIPEPEKDDDKSQDNDKQNENRSVSSSAGTSDKNDRHASGKNVPNEAKPQGCADVVPSGEAEVFQIDRQGTSATIYFAPTPGAHNYHVVFGHQEGDERYGGIAMSAVDVSGVLAIDIENLEPSQQYSFKIAPVNGCAVGNWSNWLTAKGVSRYGKTPIKTYKYTGK